MSINFSINRKKHNPKFYQILSLVFVIFCFPILCSSSTYAAGSTTGLSTGELLDFAQNNIIFYDPSECIDGNSTGICGNTSEEKIWSILRQTLDPVHAAAAFGSIAREGSFQPVKWEYEKVVTLSTCSFLVSWDDLYNGVYDGKYGVGSFGLTSGLSDYLHYVNDNAPDLLQYFKDPSNTCYSTGDELAEKIGQSAVDDLIDVEVNYFINEWIPKYKGEGIYNTFLDSTDVQEAAIIWARDIEVCRDCGCSVCASDSELGPRATAAQEYYDKYKDFTCSDTDGGSCAKLKELRTAMWTKASQKDREDFMYTVSQENYSIAGVEGYMNQALAYNDGDLSGWLDGQCSAFRGGLSCRSSHTITDEEQDWINQALNGSNNIKYAVGNATGGSNVGAGKIVCVWDGTKCRDDVDYSKQGGTGVCSVYSPSAEYGECWGLEMAESWVEDMSKQCGSDSASSDSGSSSSASSSSNSSNSSSSSGTVSGDNITWIGDSYSVQADNKGLLSEKFSGVDIGPGSNNTSSSYIQGSKFVSSGSSSNPSCLSILQDIIDSDKLRSYLVFACGTNGGWSASDITKFQDMLKDKNTKVIVVNSKIPSNDYADSNNRLKEMADSNDNIYLADWVSVYSDDYFSGDPEKIHPVTDPGYEKWVGAISDALSKAGGGGCTTYEGKYPEYRQYDERWGSLQYGSSSSDTFQNSGCGPTAMAVIVTMTSGKDVFPTDIADLLGDQYYYKVGMSTLDPIVCEKYGCEMKDISETADEVRQYLNDGWFIHTSGGGDKGTCSGGHSSTCPYSAEGHYVALLDIDNNDNVTIEDPGWGDSAIQEYKLSDIINSMGAAVAIRGSGSSGGKCSNDGVCNNSNVGSGTETSKPIGPIHDPSDDIACDPRTKDYGVRDDAYYNYEKYSIRLCSIPNIKMVGTQGDDGDDGYVHVNSRVSGAFYSLSEEHKKRCGNYLEAVDDYRTNSEQQALYDAYLNGTGNLAAFPGSPGSNHQGGLAIDFVTSTYCSSDSSVASGSSGWFNTDFLAQFGLEDGRNFSQAENWHVQAVEE